MNTSSSLFNQSKIKKKKFFFTTWGSGQCLNLSNSEIIFDQKALDSLEKMLFYTNWESRAFEIKKK